MGSRTGAVVRLKEECPPGVEAPPWPSGLTEALEDLSRQEGVSLFVVLLAAFKALLFRYTAQEDIKVEAAEINEPKVGNTGELGDLDRPTLVIRIDLAGDPTFRELIQRVRAALADAPSLRPMPSDDQHDMLGPLPGHGRRFRAGFEFGDLPSDRPVTGTPDLLLRISRDAGNLRSALWPSESLDQAMREAVLGHFQVLLEGVVAEPTVCLSRLPLLTEGERRQLLVEWSGAQVHLPESGKCIHQLFEDEARRVPDALAVVAPDGTLTYAELNRRANALARQLRVLGVGPETLVGLCVERSLEMLTGILGILKAGGAYVPLDPAYPAERLAFMLKDARVPVLLTQTPLVSGLPRHEAHILCIDALPKEASRGEDENVDSGVTPENLAYVIYTSGSTGTPKGALTTHRSMVKYAKVATLRFGVEPGDRILQFCSISFDISVEEIFLCLTRGGTLVLRTPEMLGSVSAFLQESERLDISVLSLPTAFWHEIVARLGEEVVALPPSLGLVIIGGERVQPERLARWSAHVGRRPRLLNTYGLTEASVLSTMYDLTGLEPPKPGEARDVPIGRPVDGVETYVLDQHLQPVPIGVPGELCIGGMHLARGYLNSPVATAERFVSNPFASSVSGADDLPGRLYRTGDLVRYRRDGQIEYIGRIDQQVKVRGFRVEPGEIEALLNQHPGVGETAVVVHRDHMDRNVLAAYVVPEAGRSLVDDDLRAFLKERLPDYMIPSAFVMLDTLPLSPNGKVDRAALPAPTSVSETRDPTAEPRTEVERLIAEAWQEALQIRGVSVHDNFFDLGGYSLLLMGVIERIGNKLGVNLLPDDFAVQTLGQVAAMCEEQMTAAARPAPASFLRRMLRVIRGR